MKNVTKLSEQELASGNKTSWHDQYRDSAWIFVGGLPYDLCEGDIICVFSQYGELVNINLIRDKKTGKQKGFCFICYEDQRSTVLAVDNLNGIKVNIYSNNSSIYASTLKIGFFCSFKIGNFNFIVFIRGRDIDYACAQLCFSTQIALFFLLLSQLLGKSLRVDHVANYKVPKDHEDYDDVTRRLHDEGCAPKIQIPPALIKREDARFPIKRERSPLSPPDVRRVKRESESTSHDKKVRLLSVSHVFSYHSNTIEQEGGQCDEKLVSPHAMTIKIPHGNKLWSRWGRKFYGEMFEGFFSGIDWIILKPRVVQKFYICLFVDKTSCVHHKW